MEACIQTLRTLVAKEQRKRTRIRDSVLWPAVFKSNRASVMDVTASNLLNFERLTKEQRPRELTEDSDSKSYVQSLTT